MPKRYNNIVFDLDGTIVDSAGDIAACLESVAGESLFSGEDKTYLALPLQDILRVAKPGLENAKLVELCAKFREIYDRSDYPLTKAMPGVPDALNHFFADGIAMFVATNKPIKPTLRILAKLKMTDLFKDVVSPDVVDGMKMSKEQMLGFLIGKWRLDQDTTLMVGDSDVDILASKENGISSAYLTSGYGDSSKAELLRPDFFLPCMGSLIEALRDIKD